jgi:hypothetical protein
LLVAAGNRSDFPRPLILIATKPDKDFYGRADVRQLVERAAGVFRRRRTLDRIIADRK